MTIIRPRAPGGVARALLALALVLVYPTGAGLRGAGLHDCPHHGTGHADSGSHAGHAHGAAETSGGSHDDGPMCDCPSGICAGASPTPLPGPGGSWGMGDGPAAGPDLRFHVDPRQVLLEYLLPYGNAPPPPR